jgi:polysaccharide export outer membrane protein
MRKAHLLIFLTAILALSLSSCVTNKKILYLQKEGDLKKKKNPPDTAVRHYDLVNFDYKIQTNDIVNVRFQSLTAKEFDFIFAQGQQGQQNVGGVNTGSLLNGELVDEKGEISVPVIGKVKIAGLTIFQVQDTLQKLANLYLQSPIVKARLLNYRVTFLGQVGHEGQVTLGNNRVSIMEAIGLAGGFGEMADRSNIKLIRQKGSKTEVHYLNLLKEDFVTSPYYYAYQNDLIIVPPLKQRPFHLYFTQNTAIILSAFSIFLLVVNLYKH